MPADITRAIQHASAASERSLKHVCNCACIARRSRRSSPRSHTPLSANRTTVTAREVLAIISALDFLRQRCMTPSSTGPRYSAACNSRLSRSRELGHLRQDVTVEIQCYCLEPIQWLSASADLTAATDPLCKRQRSES